MIIAIAEHATDEGHDGADRQVDVTGDDDHHHADGQDQDVGVLLDQAGDVVRHAAACRR
ncbi:MAG: hypothetical protein V9F04_13390 [Dermatophilaceae bacterium]